MDCTVVREDRCDELNGLWLEDLTSCNPLPCGESACCIDGNCSLMLPGDCLAAGGEFVPGRTTCDFDPCHDFIQIYADGTGEYLTIQQGITAARDGQTVLLHDGSASFCGMRTGLPFLSRSIIAFNTGAAAQMVVGLPDLACCDVYGNSGGDWVGCLAGLLGCSGNICTDPLFCNAAADDDRLEPGSPCAPFTAPNEECDLIGAWPVGCATSLVACCTGEDCQLASELECLAAGGEWRPGVSGCDPQPCGQAAEPPPGRINLEPTRARRRRSLPAWLCDPRAARTTRWRGAPAGRSPRA
jgi:hypothetical protein